MVRTADQRERPRSFHRPRHPRPRHDLAISFLEQAPAADRRKYTPSLVSTLVRPAGLEPTQQLVNSMITRAQSVDTLGERYLTEVFRDLAEITVRRAYVPGNVELAIAWVDQHAASPW